MNPRPLPEWLRASVAAARDLMVRRLQAPSLEPEAKRAIEMALAALDVMRDELATEVALLVRESERYAEYFEFAPDACLITDAGGTIREANQAALELLNATRDGVVGHPLAHYLGEENRAQFLSRRLGRGESALDCWTRRTLPP